MSLLRKATVRLGGHPVGRLEEVDRRTTRFTYDAAWLAHPARVPVSHTLPLRAEPFETDGLHPFFENLLPEGWLLELSTRKLRISKDDAFGLLIATCADCIGAVEILTLEESPR